MAGFGRCSLAIVGAELSMICMVINKTGEMARRDQRIIIHTTCQ